MRSSPSLEQIIPRVEELLITRRQKAAELAKIDLELAEVFGMKPTNTSVDVEKIEKRGRTKKAPKEKTSTKKERLCGRCKMPGHIARHCTHPEEKSDVNPVMHGEVETPAEPAAPGKKEPLSFQQYDEIRKTIAMMGESFNAGKFGMLNKMSPLEVKHVQFSKNYTDYLMIR